MHSEPLSPAWGLVKVIDLFQSGSMPSTTDVAASWLLDWLNNASFAGWALTALTLGLVVFPYFDRARQATRTQALGEIVAQLEARYDDPAPDIDALITRGRRQHESLARKAFRSTARRYNSLTWWLALILSVLLAVMSAYVLTFTIPAGKFVGNVQFLASGIYSSGLATWLLFRRPLSDMKADVKEARAEARGEAAEEKKREARKRAEAAEARKREKAQAAKAKEQEKANKKVEATEARKRHRTVPAEREVKAAVTASSSETPESRSTDSKSSHRG